MSINNTIQTRTRRDLRHILRTILLKRRNILKRKILSWSLHMKTTKLIQLRLHGQQVCATDRQPVNDGSAGNAAGQQQAETNAGAAGKKRKHGGRFR